MQKIRIGIIGTGVGIRTHLSGFRLHNDDAEIVAICGSSKERSQEFATKHNIPIACADYKELCELDNVDLVCVTPPNRFHFEAVKYAMSKGKHIICEKPLSANMEEVNELVNEVRNYDKIAVVSHQLRYNPYIKKIKEMITTGELGNVLHVRFHQTGSGFANPNTSWMWSFDGDEGGGVRLAMASHFNDLMQFWFADRNIVSVNGYMNPVTKTRLDKEGNQKNVTGSTICTALINFEGELNVQYAINAGSYLGSRFDVNIFGTKGELTFSLQNKLAYYSRDSIGLKQPITVEGVFPDEAENKISIFSGSFRYFAPVIIKAIQKNDYSFVSDAATFNDAIYNIGLLDAIQKSANQGVGLSLGKENNNYV
jgi:predicted dehydrogenase